MFSGSEQKPTLALIHGWGIGASAWQTASDELSTHFNLRLLDLPGYGGARLADGASFEQTALSFISELPENAIVCGWSLGAMLAMQMALLAPGRIAHLVLVGATPSFTQRDDWSSAQPPALLDSFSTAAKQDASETRRRFVALLNQGDREARALTRSMTRALAADTAPEIDALLAGLAWLRDVDLRTQVASIATPTLIIHGAHDPLMPLAAAQTLHAQIAGSHLEIFPDAAHAPFAHDPQGFAALLTARHAATRR